MFDVKTNHELVKYMVGGIAVGIAYLSGSFFYISSDIKMLNSKIDILQNESNNKLVSLNSKLEKAEVKINLLVAYIQDPRASTKTKHLNKDDLLKLISKNTKKTPLNVKSSTYIDKINNIVHLAKENIGKNIYLNKQHSTISSPANFTSYIYEKNGLKIPKTYTEQFMFGKRISSIHNLQKGDLVFFDSKYKYHNINKHNRVGIYIGNGKFIHASSKTKIVEIKKLNDPYYAEHFKLARRITRENSL